MADLNKIYLYRITHIENVPHILDKGVTHKNSPLANPQFTPIGDPNLISTRSHFAAIPHLKLPPDPKWRLKYDGHSIYATFMLSLTP